MYHRRWRWFKVAVVGVLLSLEAPGIGRYLEREVSGKAHAFFGPGVRFGEMFKGLLTREKKTAMAAPDASLDGAALDFLPSHSQALPAPILARFGGFHPILAGSPLQRGAVFVPPSSTSPPFPTQTKK